ncbi:hypothetical protein LA733_3020 [Leptospira interrogans]|uniref:Uncharacterized protein n=6 Tax=Leptospira interrogans TaxID=173 RepID=Q72TP6_LEPIC|nr:conserved hypothetical protein [Leptospira interrogans serovar Copenhageni str. Fiocruz L1-130]ASP41766.1 hypothetical protein AMR47_07660 [Leptospira interrogans]KAA5550152.1 hypothetical protein F3G11_13995 [Leptospira interrogans serovar Copenhageni]QOI39322.1 hypothetical protein Lepto1548_14270 [Leptospira interrogans serovar Bataviae]WPM71977.1 hypothetical protein FYB70_05190 [Leptospira interrogans serovar Icterohaemorrhagiae]
MRQHPLNKKIRIFESMFRLGQFEKIESGLKRKFKSLDQRDRRSILSSGAFLFCLGYDLVIFTTTK